MLPARSHGSLDQIRPGAMLNPTTGVERVEYSFQGGADGANAQSPLLDVRGTLYGTTAIGVTGTCKSGCGTVYGFTP
jgi:hypothetical protein